MESCEKLKDYFKYHGDLRVYVTEMYLSTATSLDNIFTRRFRAHPGADCFLMKRGIIENLQNNAHIRQ